MPRPIIVPADVIIQGSLQSSTMTIPANAVNNAAVIAGAGITADKLQHQHAIHYNQQSGTAVVADAGRVLHTVRGLTGTVLQVDVFPEVAPTNGGSDDKAYTVDIQKSTGGGAFATILTAPLSITKTRTARVTLQAALSGTPALVVGDALKVIVAVSGSVGTQGTGLNVTIHTREDAD